MTSHCLHILPTCLTIPTNPIKVHVVGAGGTGSHLITHLADITKGMIALGHPGLAVTLFDPDTVATHNLVRQQYLPQEVGQFKAAALIGRINRATGFHWKAVPMAYGNTAMQQYDMGVVPITICCVDEVSPRKQIADMLVRAHRQYKGHADQPLYLIDTGNETHTGQVILSTLGPIKQTRSTTYRMVSSLPLVTEEFGYLLVDKPNLPTCSAAESIAKQDPFINKEVAMTAAGLLWNCLRDRYTSIRGAFIDCKRFEKRPIPITANHQNDHANGKAKTRKSAQAKAAAQGQIPT